MTTPSTALRSSESGFCRRGLFYRAAEMRTATLTDLRRHFRRISAWIENGETVQILKRGKAFARLVPEVVANPAMSDFATRRKAIWGDRVFTPAEVKTMRDAELEGEEG